VTFDYQHPDASTPRHRRVTDEDGRRARRRAELRSGEAARNVAEAAASDLLGTPPVLDGEADA
jgi:hypothetical protein